jgi:hypothetical protein
MASRLLDAKRKRQSKDDPQSMTPPFPRLPRSLPSHVKVRTMNDSAQSEAEIAHFCHRTDGEGHRRPGRVVEHVITAMIAGGHVLLEGVPGLGKTMLVARSPARSRSISSASSSRPT